MRQATGDNIQPLPQTPASPPGSGFLLNRVGLVAVFLLSGCAALTYEVVWFQLLRLTVGGSSISLAMTLGAFMGGLCLGACVAPWLSRRGYHPLRIYAVLEIGIAAIGLAMPWIVPWISGFYTHYLDLGMGSDLILRAVVCGLVLIPPAALMGATLPVVARWLGGSRRGVAWVSALYAVNTFGAVAGTLLAGFVWLRLLSIVPASFIAAGMNILAALIAWSMTFGVASVTPDAEPEDQQTVEPDAAGPPPNLRARALMVIALSGFTALGAQVLWTRALALLLAVTVYTFSIILAVFLLGLAFGAVIGAAVGTRSRRPGFWLALSQLGLVPAIGWAYWAIANRVQARKYAVGGPGDGIWMHFASDLVRCAEAIGPATVLWGASFPLALALGGRGRAGGERWVAKVYAVNTLGAILGVMLFTFVGLGIWGSDRSAHVLMAVAGLSGLVILRKAADQEESPALVSAPPTRWRLSITTKEAAVGLWGLRYIYRGRLHHWARYRAVRAVVLLSVLLAAYFGPGIADDLLIYGRSYKTGITSYYNVIEVAEGVSTSAGVVDVEGGERELYVSGKVVASTYETDMRNQRLLGYTASLTHGSPKSVLIVGMGTGTTAGSFVLNPNIERIVICEIEPEVLKLAGRHFAEENHRVLEDPRTVVVIDDGRHYLATTEERFDIITSDPIHPWVKGASALYSRQYYDLVQSRLNPGGVVTQWVPFYETSYEAARSMVATFFEVFPDGSVWHSGAFGDGHDVVMLAQPGRKVLDLDQWVQQLENNPAFLEDLAAAGVPDIASLLSRFTSHADDVKPWLADATINRDRSLRLEYLAGLGLFTSAEFEMQEQLESHRQWPNPKVKLAQDMVWTVQALFDERAVDAQEDPTRIIP